MGDPRCGSHWLQSMLSPTFSLDEITTYRLYTEYNHDFYFDEHNFIERTYNKSVTPPITENKFIQKRIYQIKKINPLQEVKGILFCSNVSYDYKEIINALIESNFKFILLERNLFDRALSHIILNYTGIAHRWTGQVKIPNPDALQPITVNLSKWLEILFLQNQTTEFRKNLFLNVDTITVRYENLLEDCEKNNITLMPHKTIYKTWDVNYEDIVTNINELRDIYNSFVNYIPVYKKFLLDGAKI